jgi:hypothetical protein
MWWLPGPQHTRWRKSDHLSFAPEVWSELGLGAASSCEGRKIVILEFLQDDDGLWRWRLQRLGLQSEVIAVSGDRHTRRRGAQRAWVRAKWAFATMSNIKSAG